MLNMLIDIDKAVTCAPAPGFVLFPLPTKKVLWETRTAEAWRTEFKETMKETDLFGVSTEGELKGLKLEY